MQPWKDRASQALPTEDAQKLALAVDIATRTYDIMSSAYTGLSFGLGAAIFAGGWTAAGFGQIVPGTEDIAKALYKQLRVSVSKMWAGIAADPPDPNFATVAQPVFQTLDSTGDTSYDDLADALMRAAAYGDASRIANERYQGAVAAGDHAAAAMQAEASANFTYDMIGQLRRENTLQPQVATAAWANEPIVQPPAGQDAATWWTNEIDGIAALTPADLSASDRQFLKDHDPDITDAQIDAAVAKWSDPTWIAQMRSVDPSQTIADTLNDNTALIPDTITTLDAFGRWMSLNSADEQAQVPAPPTNHKPVSSFNADKLTGTAPLTVTFDSTATDPDGDALSLHWDIAGTDSADGVTSVTHTFTTPGTYGISLVATDPTGAWDQAVKWITVYPDGVDPGSTNNPPVAQFTPQIVDANGPITQTFTSTSFDPDGDPLTQTWYFGDGTTATGASVTKTFPAGYIMSVLLVVSDGDLTGQAAGQVTSRDTGGPDPGQPPTASFTADPNSGTSPLAVNFTSTSSDPDGDPLTETWYFGDGGTATGPTATHTYTAAGSYTATLVVSDGPTATAPPDRSWSTPSPRSRRRTRSRGLTMPPHSPTARASWTPGSPSCPATRSRTRSVPPRTGCRRTATPAGRRSSCALPGTAATWSTTSCSRERTRRHRPRPSRWRSARATTRSARTRRSSTMGPCPATTPSTPSVSRSKRRDSSS